MTDEFHPLTEVPVQAPPQNTPPVKKLGRFAASHLIAKSSWNILKQDKEMMWFPILSIIASMVVCTLFFVAYLVLVAGGSMENIRTLGEPGTGQDALGWVEYAYFFAFYVVTYFVAIFFQAGIVAIAHGRINGQDLSFSDGIGAAQKRVGKLFVWSLINATVGLILQQIVERSKLLGKIAARLMGALWSLLTYFILPTLMIEQLGIGDSLKRSGETIKKTWGETIIVNVGVGLYFFVLSLAGIALFVGALFLGDATIIVLAGILLIIYLLVISLIASTLGVIFKVILYEYASKGVIPQGVPSEIVAYAFKQQ